MYENYKNSRDLAWCVLIDQHISKLPVSVTDICRNMEIAIKLYEPSDDNSGYSTIINGKAIIFVSCKDTRERQRFTVAHELGHILLGHVGKYELVNREPSSKDNPIEQAANVFASRLLAPACVLWGCGAKKADQIAKLCEISYQAAEYRANRMKVLYARNAFLKSSLERQVYENFKNYITKTRL